MDLNDSLMMLPQWAFSQCLSPGGEFMHFDALLRGSFGIDDQN